MGHTMGHTTITSTFLLTLLLLVGLFFFIRASAKDRTEQLRLASAESVETLHQQLKDYLDGRAYRVKAFEGENGRVIWEGWVQPSLGLAFFLSFLAAVGLFCLALVLQLAVPQGGSLWLGVLLLCPLAGWFYWNKAGRLEEVTYRILSVQGATDLLDVTPPATAQSILKIAAHRDELLSLQQAIALQALEPAN